MHTRICLGHTANNCHCFVGSSLIVCDRATAVVANNLDPEVRGHLAWLYPECFEVVKAGSVCSRPEQPARQHVDHASRNAGKGSRHASLYGTFCGSRGGLRYARFDASGVKHVSCAIHEGALCWCDNRPLLKFMRIVYSKLVFGVTRCARYCSSYYSPNLPSPVSNSKLSP